MPPAAPIIAIRQQAKGVAQNNVSSIFLDAGLATDRNRSSKEGVDVRKECLRGSSVRPVINIG